MASRRDLASRRVHRSGLAKGVDDRAAGDIRAVERAVGHLSTDESAAGHLDVDDETPR